MAEAATAEKIEAPAPGIYAGISNADYHAGPGVSSSGLKLIERSPLHFWDRYLNPKRESSEPTPAMVLGSLTHSTILEPDLVGQEYAVAPQGIDRRTKAGKEEWAAFQEDAKGKTIVTADQMDTARAMRDAVYRHPKAPKLIAGGRIEQSVYWHDDDTGELCKCRPDVFKEGGILTDVKTTDDASPRAFARAVVNFGYHTSGAFYRDGLAEVVEPVRFLIWLVVEKSPPYGIAIYMADEAALERGYEVYRRALTTYHECRQAGKWPGYATDVQTLSLPAWAFND